MITTYDPSPQNKKKSEDLSTPIKNKRQDSLAT
jgi:hypothetical protein